MGTGVYFETYLYEIPHFSVIIYLTESQIEAIPQKAFLDVGILLQ